MVTVTVMFKHTKPMQTTCIINAEMKIFFARKKKLN